MKFSLRYYLIFTNDKKHVKFIKSLIIISIYWSTTIMTIFTKKKTKLFIKSNLSKDSNINIYSTELIDKGIDVTVLDISKKISSFYFIKKIIKARDIYIDNIPSKLVPIKLTKKQTVIQLWHGSGSLKAVGTYRTGMTGKNFEKLGEMKFINYLVIESESIKPEISKAFNIPEDKIVIAKTPRINKYLKSIKNGDGVLFAPTFRVDKDGKRYYPDSLIDWEVIKNSNKKWFIKLHHSINNIKLPDFVVDASQFDIETCLKHTNIIISDYSSVPVEYMVGGKTPFYITYAPDLNEYKEKNGFMPSYKKYLSGQIAHSFIELNSFVNNPTFSREMYLNNAKIDIDIDLYNLLETKIGGK